MKYTAIFLILLVVVVISMTAYAWMNTTIVCTATGVQVDSAEIRPSDFFELQIALDNNAVQGTAYQTSLAGGPGDYCIMTFNINIENKCLLDAEMVEIQIRPIDGDVVCFSGTGGIDRSLPANIKALSAGNVTCVLLTKAGNHAVRQFLVTYYIWGRPYSAQCIFG